jgi:GNAT superfamily N-acetyltransferase
VIEPTEVELDDVVANDLARLVTFENILWAEEEPGEPLIAERVVAWMNRRLPRTNRWAWIAESDGQFAGVAVLRGSVVDNLHLGILHVRVVPQARRQGIGRSLLAAAARRAHDDGRRLLSGWTWDTVASGEPFVRAMGAAPAMLIRRSEVDLVALDRSRLPAWLDVPPRTSDRYDLVTVIGRYPEDQYEAIAEVEEVMNTAPHDDLDVEDEVRDAAWVAAREASYDPSVEERWTIFARERSTGRFVGYTQVFFYDDWPGMVNQGNTGVHPDHRGYGLGLWLKAAMLERIFTEKPASRRMRTTNAYSNAPMLAINDELGYRVTATQTTWQAETADVLRRTTKP